MQFQFWKRAENFRATFLHGQAATAKRRGRPFNNFLIEQIFFAALTSFDQKIAKKLENTKKKEGGRRKC